MAGQTLKWNYRKELVKRWNLDHRHYRTQISIVISIILGILGFLLVKTDVMNNRRIQMAKKEAYRKEKYKLNHDGIEPKNKWNPEELK